MSISLQELKLWKATFARGKGLFAGFEKQNKTKLRLTIASFPFVYFDLFSGMHVRVVEGCKASVYSARQGRRSMEGGSGVSAPCPVLFGDIIFMVR